MKRTLRPCCLGSIVFVVLLLSIGWNAQQVRNQQLQNLALYAAVYNNDPAATSAALARGADPEGRHMVPLGKEVHSPWDAIIALFHRANKTDLSAMTPLAEAALPMPGQSYSRVQTPIDRTPVMQILLDHGAKINAGRNIGQTALGIAVLNDQVAAVRFLLKHGADANARDASSMTPLMLATCFPGNLEIVRLLLDQGADVNVHRLDGDTALIDAAQYQGPDVVKLLLDHHADVRFKGLSGLTALGRAERYRTLFMGDKPEQQQIVTMLKKAGATE